MEYFQSILTCHTDINLDATLKQLLKIHFTQSRNDIAENGACGSTVG
jgi:hypothetical protein